MEFLGIGPMELVFILIIILLVIGPKDIEKTAGNIGRFLNRLNRSPNYRAIRKASEELRNLPQRLVHEAQLEELKDLDGLKQIEKDLKDTAKTISAAQQPFQAWVKDMKAPLTGGTSPPPSAAPNGPAAAPAATPPATPDAEVPASAANESPPKV